MLRNRLLTIGASLIFILGILYVSVIHPRAMTGAPPYDTAADEGVDVDEYAWLKSWKRPEGPPRVGLQAGHWKNDELPEELATLRGSTGSSGGGKSEWEVNIAIANETKTLLEARGIVVDILPATVPPKYWADAFIAIHADGNLDTRVRGFKAAAPRRDMSGNADDLLASVTRSYGVHTGLTQDPNVSRNMRGYYAFTWWRREHAIHPMTAAIILETGFLTNAGDRSIIVHNPATSANGLAQGIIEFLAEEQLL